MLARDVSVRPAGVKLELTHSCNLRCDFCYTDSPRHTVARTADLEDDVWRAIVAEALDLGVTEAVITGGEPLLRAPLALELAERLTAEGVGVSFNTNGWFVDERCADRLAGLPGLTVHLSIDGATPQLHDGARGVRGSWRRVVRAAGLLLDRGARISVVHVVTPLNAASFPAFLELLRLLGIQAVRVTGVVPVGAASRGSDWPAEPEAIAAAIASARDTFGDDLNVVYSPADNSVPDEPALRFAPSSLLVRPDGTIRTDSLNPFSFGRADEGLAPAWQRICEHWSDSRIEDWKQSIRSAQDYARATPVPYAEPEAPAVGDGAQPAAHGKALRLPRRTASSRDSTVAPGDLDAARAHVRALALDRRYRLAPHRWSGAHDGNRYVRLLETGSMLYLNATAGAVLDSVDNRPGRAAVTALAERHAEADRRRLEDDVVVLLHQLRRLGALLPCGRLEENCRDVRRGDSERPG